ALAVQPHREPAVVLLLEQLVRPVVPDLDGARAVVPLRNLPLEASVLERVILDVNREMLLAGLERNALRHRPGREHAVAFEPEVVVQPPGIVTLNDEDRILVAGATPERLGGLLPVSLALVFRELLAHVSRSRVVFLRFTQRVHSGDKPVDGVDSAARFCLSISINLVQLVLGVDAEGSEARAPAAAQVVAGNRVAIGERTADLLSEQARR